MSTIGVLIASIASAKAVINTPIVDFMEENNVLNRKMISKSWRINSEPTTRGYYSSRS